MEELHQRLSSHEGVRFQILARQQNGPDVVLAEAMLSSSALMELAIDSENALDQDAELPGRDFTVEAVVDTAKAKAAGAIFPNAGGRPKPVLRLCVEYRCNAMRLREEQAAAPSRQFPGQARLAVCGAPARLQTSLLAGLRFHIGGSRVLQCSARRALRMLWMRSA